MINYKILGEQNEKVLVFLSGLGANLNIWKYQEELSDTYKLILFDYVGERDDNSTITIDFLADKVIKILIENKINKYNLVGHSLGGILAQSIYEKCTDNINSLVLANSTSIIDEFLTQILVDERRQKLFSMTDEEYINSVVKNCLLSRSDELIEDTEKMFTVNRDTYIETASCFKHKDYSGVARRIDKPVLICSGWFDMITPYILQLQQSMMIRRSVHKQFWSGHLPNIECPKEFNKVVREFMKEIK